jgi:ATP-dependent DNA ligase
MPPETQTPNLVPIPPDPLEWRPQKPLATRTRREVTNAVIEPLWDGDHVLAHFDAGAGARPRLLLIADDGEDVTQLDPDVTEQLRDAIRAEGAVLDGFLTPQATRASESVSLSPSVKPGRFNLLYSRSVETDVAPPPLEPDTPIAFVAVDLLRVDGQDLFDIPLLERKRLLESIVVESERVRVSPFTQPPVANWLRTWRAAGFRGVLLKAANSRYRPGHETGEWVAALSSRR